MDEAEISWVDPKGLETPVTEMSDRHLRNCIALINRKLKEVEYDRVSEKIWRQWAEMMPVLLAEQRRRKENGIVIASVS